MDTGPGGVLVFLQTANRDRGRGVLERMLGEVLNHVSIYMNHAFRFFQQQEPLQLLKTNFRAPRVSLSIVEFVDPYTEGQIRWRVIERRSDPQLKYYDAMSLKYVSKPWPYRDEKEPIVLLIGVKRSSLFRTALRPHAAEQGFLGAKIMKILGISGSLRNASVNTALLRRAAALTPNGVTFIVYDGLGNLPHFNPELDREPLPPAVSDFRSHLTSSAGVIISSPEYAHGIPGVLKNALDWVVASGELYEKPVALFNTSPRIRYAQAALAETLTVMTARLIPEASLNPAQATGDGGLHIGSDADLPKRIEYALSAFVKAIDLA